MRKRLLGSIVVALLALLVIGLVVRHGGSAAAFYPLPLPMSGYPEMVAVDPRTERFFVPTSGGVSIRDGATGALVRTIPLTIDPQSTMFDARTGRVLVVGLHGISLLDARTGRVLRTGSASLSPVALALWGQGERAFVVDGQTNTLRAIDARSGRLLPAANMVVVPGPSAFNGVAVDGRTRHVFVTSPGDNSLSVLNGWTGHVLTTLAVPAPGVLAVDGRTGHVFVATDGVYACPHGLASCHLAGIGVSMLDARTGAVLCHVRVPRGTMPIAVAVDERAGRAYVVTGVAVYPQPGWTSSLLVLDARSGKVLRTQPLGRTYIDANQGPSRLAVDEQRNRVYVILQGATSPGPGSITWGFITDATPGHLDVFDAQTGTLLRTVTTGINPMHIAVNEQTGRVLVLDAGGYVRVPGAWDWVPQGLRRLLPFLPRPGDQARLVPSGIMVLP